MATQKQVGTCSYSKCSNTFTKRNYKQHACCASHRTLSNREKSGKTNPYIGKKSTSKSTVEKDISAAAFSAAIPAMLGGSSAAKITEMVGAAVVSNAAIPNVLSGINDGSINPLAAGSGAAGGYFISGFFTKSPLLRILAALGGGWATNRYWSMVAVPIGADSAIETMHKELASEALSPDHAADIINSREYRQLQIPSYETLAPKYSDLFGHPSTDFFMMIHGTPGQGKSHWAAKFANHFHANHGKVLYYASEQNGLSKSFQDIQRKIKSSFDVHTHPEKLTKQEMVVHFNHYRLVVIDSANTLNLSPEDIKLIRDNSSAAVMVILQSNKDGDFKGVQNWLHDADISIKMESRRPIVEKSRFGGGDQKPMDKGRVVSL